MEAWEEGIVADVFDASIEYNRRDATFHEDHVTLSTVGGRITAEYVLPDDDRETSHSKYLFSEAFETTGATLHYRETTNEFRITDVQEHRILVEYHEDSRTIPLQREQFETLYDGSTRRRAASISTGFRRTPIPMRAC